MCVYACVCMRACVRASVHPSISFEFMVTQEEADRADVIEGRTHCLENQKYNSQVLKSPLLATTAQVNDANSQWRRLYIRQVIKRSKWKQDKRTCQFKKITSKVNYLKWKSESNKNGTNERLRQEPLLFFLKLPSNRMSQESRQEADRTRMV